MDGDRPYIINYNKSFMKDQDQLQPTTEVKLPSSKQVAKAYKVNIRTARRYLKQRTILKIGRKPKMDEIDLLAFLNRYLVENLDASQAEMAEFLFQRTGKRLSQQAIS
jgi:hypothetical protein